MLKKDVLKANAVLASLTDEQIAAIEKLSENDENSVIATKVGEIHRKYDETILRATGIERDGDEKSYVYLERAGKTLKSNLEKSKEAATQVEALQAEKARLEKLIQDGDTGGELKTQLKNIQAELAQTKNQYTEIQTKLAETEQQHKQKVFGMQVDFEINKATGGLKFKPELPESATNVLLQQAVQKIKSHKPEFIDDGKGGQRLVFRNEAGAILNNPEKQLNPYTASELLASELKAMGVLDSGRKAKGAGTNGNGKSGGDTPTVLDLSGVKNRVQANEAISEHLSTKGLTRGSKEFDEEAVRIWRENKVSELPEN